MGRGDRRGKMPKALPELAKVMPLRAHARDRRGTGVAPKPEDARKTALEARCHHVGITPDRDNRAKVTAPWLSVPLGMVMHRICNGEECSRLWSVWQGWCAAERTYRVRYIGQTGEAKGAAIAMVPDKMEADTGHTIDARTGDERDRDAVNTWMRWQGYLGMLPSVESATLLHQARREDGPPLWLDRKPTVYGGATLHALRLLADVVERDGGRKKA